MLTLDAFDGSKTRMKRMPSGAKSTSCRIELIATRTAQSVGQRWIASRWRTVRVTASDVRLHASGKT